MYFCVSYALGYFSVMISTEVYLTIYDIFVRHDVMRVISSVVSRSPLVSVSLTRRARSKGMRARLMGPCLHAWAVCREVLYIQPCPDGKTAKVMS